MSSFLAGPSRRGNQPNEVVTYRHLLSPQAMTVFNPLRTIAHCDIDAAYAQFESVRLGIPDDVPLICAQWQSIIAVNYPARKFGIKRFNTIDEAKRMCPQLYVQHVATYRNGESEAGYWGEVDPATHKVSLDPYRRESLKILAIFKEMVPKGEIEKASIDEAFLDLSPMVIDRLLAIHPHLSEPPADAPEGLDSPLPPPPPIDWTKAGNVFPLDGEEAGTGEDVTEDGEGEDHMYSSQKSDDEHRPGGVEGGKLVERGVTWEDWALCVGAEIMVEVREQVWKRLHYTCSAGIAHSKAMAKLCSAWKKPNNQTILRKAATPAFLRNMNFTDIRFLGGKLGNAIATEYGAKTVGDLLLVPLEEMQARFGEESIWVYNIVRGIDHTEVKERTATKSMLASKNTRPAVTTPEQGMHWIGVLAGELNVRLRDAREIAPGLWPKTLVLGHRTGIEAGRSRQIPFPFTRTLSTEYIVKHAKKLWDEVCQPMRTGTSMKLNNMSLSFTGLERLEGGQQGIEGFFGGASASAAKPTPVVNSPKRRRSPSPVKPYMMTGADSKVSSPAAAVAAGPSPKKPRLPTLHAGPARKTVLESFLSGPAKRGESSTTTTPVPALAPVHDDKPVEVVDISDEEDSTSTGTDWQCPKCGFKPPQLPLGGGGDDDDIGKMAEARQEHEDFHFAQDLQQAGSSPVRSKSAVAVVKPKAKVKKKKEEGIKAFFAPKPVKKE